MAGRRQTKGPLRPDTTTGLRGALRPPGLAVLFVVPVLAFSAVAKPLDDAQAAYKRGDYATAARIYRSLADQGDATAQNRLGAMHLNGQGGKRSDAEAVKWFRRAAALGSPSAQFNLAEMYFKGRGVDPDLLQAAKWYSRAAEQGHAQAQFTLAALYLIGGGVPKNSQKAAYWFERAAAQGHGEAQAALGRMYGAGQGVPKNLVTAYKWLALSRVNSQSGKTRVDADRSLQRIAASMTPAQVGQAQRQAGEWRATPSKVQP